MATRMKLGKIFLRNKSDIVRHAVLQLLSDWAFMFGNQSLGRYSVVALREIYNKYGMTICPTARAAEIYETIRRSEQTHLLKGFEFENRPDQISINCEKSEPLLGLQEGIAWLRQEEGDALMYVAFDGGESQVGIGEEAVRSLREEHS